MEKSLKEIQQEFEETRGTNEYDKEQLLKILALSLGAEAITKTGLLKKVPGGVITSELIENIISQIIADYGNIQLSKFDNIAGAIPLTGVTAVTVHCARRLVGMYLDERETKA